MEVGVLYNGVPPGLTSDAIQFETPVSGGTVQVLPNTMALLLNPAGALAALTIVMPTSPTDGQRCLIASSASITLLSITGATIKGTLASMALNGYARFLYSVAGNCWFRTG